MKKTYQVDPKNFSREENPHLARVLAAGFSKHDLALLNVLETVEGWKNTQVLVAMIKALRREDEKLIGLIEQAIDDMQQIYLNLHASGVLNHDHLVEVHQRLSAWLKTQSESAAVETPLQKEQAQDIANDLIARVQRPLQ